MAPAARAATAATAVPGRTEPTALMAMPTIPTGLPAKTAAPEAMPVSAGPAAPAVMVAALPRAMAA
jgi:hypothetical protein